MFDALIARVGGPWGWTRRPKYADVFARAARLAQPDTRLFLFEDSGERVGYALTHALRVPPPALEGSGSVVEIENFGLFPEHTGQGLGRVFLPLVFRALFEQGAVGAVYLTTRSTNHAGVVPFYEGLGMRVIARERLPDDCLSAPRAA